MYSDDKPEEKEKQQPRSLCFNGGRTLSHPLCFGTCLLMPLYTAANDFFCKGQYIIRYGSSPESVGKISLNL